MRAIATHRIPAAILGLTLVLGPALARAEEWPPVTADELQMTEEPQAPKAPAIILYRQVDRDDQDFFERDYVRLKVLTEEGRRYADLKIYYDKSRESIHDIEARAIQPDGTVTPFTGTVYESPVAEGQGANLVAKALAVPDVQVGTIIEYRWRQRFRYGLLYGSQWTLSSELFTRDAKFTLRPHDDFRLKFSWPMGLPAGTNPPTSHDHKILLEAHDVPPFVAEDYMPPAGELQYRVEFAYVGRDYKELEPVKFWATFSKSTAKGIEEFTDEPRLMAQAAAEIVSPGDSPETKLRKLYTRVQQLENTSYEEQKSKQEEDRENSATSVAQVWQKASGTGAQLNWLFMALARGAGLHAEPVAVSDRERVLFDASFMNAWQLYNSFILVSQDGKDWYLDPGSAFLPFGMLPWNKTGVRGLVLAKDGGRWIDTPLPEPADSQIRHRANLKLTTAGALIGRVTITYTGSEARACRLHERNQDTEHRRKYLEELVRLDVPLPVVVSNLSAPDWGNSEVPFEFESDIAIADWANLTGQRAVARVGIFSSRLRNTFEHTTRVHAIYFPFPFEYRDEVHLELPPQWKVASLPKAHGVDIDALQYHSAVQQSGDALELTRDLISRVTLLNVKYYDALHAFFDAVRSGDAEQLVVATAGSAGRP
jgi:hypothetical protein